MPATIAGFKSRTTTIAGVRLHYWIGGARTGEPAGTDGYDARSLAEECRALAATIGFGGGRPLIHAAHDMGAFTWFYEGDHVVNHAAFSRGVIDEYLRSFAGTEGVLGSMGIYRAAFASMDQTEPLMAAKITLPGCGHFMIEERPQFVVDQILNLSDRLLKGSEQQS